MRYCLMLCMCLFATTSTLFAQSSLDVSASNDGIVTPSNNDNEVTKLELAGGDSFEYDINNKIRKAKSSVQVSVGMNFTYNHNKDALQVNASIGLGYSYFFHKTFGIRAQGVFDNMQSGYFGGIAFDAIWDFIQTEPFGLGIILGSSAGYQEQYGVKGQNGFLGQLHVGVGMIFDGGRSRLDGLTRIPYSVIMGNQESLGIVYILMYSYTF